MNLHPLLVAVVAALALAGCGGNDDSASKTPSTTTTTVEPSQETGTETETDTGSSAGSTVGGPAPEPGQGALELDDGRSLAIAISKCEFQPSGTFELTGTSDQGSTFEMTQFYLGDAWSQTDASIKRPNGDQIYVIVNSATPGGEPATVDGKTVAWVQTFRELDESANDFVYSGEGVLRVTCP